MTTKDNRRQFLSKALAVGSAALLPLSGIAGNTESTNENNPLPLLKGRKVLFTYGGWDGHEPVKYSEYMSAWLKEEGADVHLSDTLEPYADKTLMDTIDLVIQ